MAEFNSESYICQNIKGKFNEEGIGGVRKYVEFNLEQWKSETVSIAVTGISGVGKSTFINAFRNMKNDAPGAAKTGSKQTTTVIKSYEDPTNPNIKLFDLPGVGTNMFTKEKYFEMIDFDRFDAFLLMTATRFFEIDTWLVKELKARNKPLYLVRTKVWNDVRNDNETVTVKIPAERIIDDIRTCCRMHVEDTSVNIYLIDSYKKMNDKLDFMILRKDVVESLPKQKKEVLVYAVQDFTQFTPDLIKTKGEMLRKRIWKKALLSGIIGLVPLLGFSLVVDISLVQNEKDFYTNQLGIGKCVSMDVTNSLLSEEALRVINGIARLWQAGLSIEVVNALVKSETAETVAKFIPIIGSIVGGTISFAGTALVLHKLLDKMIADAIKINELMLNELAKSVEN